MTHLPHEQGRHDTVAMIAYSGHRSCEDRHPARGEPRSVVLSPSSTGACPQALGNGRAVDDLRSLCPQTLAARVTCSTFMGAEPRGDCRTASP